MGKSLPTLKSALQEGQVLSCSINPQNQHFFHAKYWENFTTKSFVLATCKRQIEKITDIFGNTATFMMYPDISSPESMFVGKYPRVHYHGFVVIHHPLLFHLIMAKHMCNEKSRNHFSMEIDTIDDFIHWTRYCLKSQPLFKLKYFYHSNNYGAVSKFISDDEQGSSSLEDSSDSESDSA